MSEHCMSCRILKMKSGPTLCINCINAVLTQALTSKFAYVVTQTVT